MFLVQLYAYNHVEFTTVATEFARIGDAITHIKDNVYKSETWMTLNNIDVKKVKAGSRTMWCACQDEPVHVLVSKPKVF